MLHPETAFCVFSPHFHTGSHLRQNVQYVDYGHYSKFSQMHPGFPLRGPNRETQARSILRMGKKIYFIRLTVTSIYSKNAAVWITFNTALLAICICNSYNFKGLLKQLLSEKDDWLFNFVLLYCINLCMFICSYFITGCSLVRNNVWTLLVG